jgi:hypothetical protein
MDMNRFLRTTGIALVAIAAVGALGTLLVRDQISRHQRDLFSPHPLRRLAALGYLGGRPASVDAILLLRDFIAWEPQPMLKKRAMQLLARMEDALDERAIEPEVV